MKLSNHNSKRDYYITRYNRSFDYSLLDVYKNPSQAKRNAYTMCMRKFYENDGWGAKILSFNCHMFTFGFLYQEPATGVVMLNVETAYNSYQMEY